MLAFILAANLALPEWGIADPKTIARGELSVTDGKLQVECLRTSGHPVDLPPPPEPRAGAIRPDLARALWVWTPDDALPEFVTRNHINRVYLQVPKRPWGSDLESLVARVTEAGARVYALDGDRLDALPENHASVRATVAAVAEFNSHARVPFVGVHLDIEPYLLPGFGGVRRDAILEGYLALVQALRGDCDRFKLRLELDVPTWYDAPDELGGYLPRPVMHRIIDLADSVTLMDYRTDPHRSLAEASPHVKYATKTHKEVLVGFETMPLPDEELYFFRGPAANHPGSSGFWVAVQGGELRLLSPDQPRTGQTADAWYSVTHHLPLTGDSQSFGHLGLSRLDQSIDYLGRRLSSQAGFGGFAIHHYGSYRTLLAEKP